MDHDLRILILEDRPEDVQLVERELRRGGIAFTSRHTEDGEAFAAALSDFQPDLVISDYSLPDYDGLMALEHVRQRHPDLPFILLSGLIGEERTIEAFGNGVTDVILKNNLVRLVHSVTRVIQQIEVSEERHQLHHQLHNLQREFERVARTTELSELAASISHEVCQPLAAIVFYLGAANAALAESRDTYVQEVVQKASEQALGAGEIVQRLKSFLRGGADVREILSAGNVTNDAVRIALIDAPARGIEIVQRFESADVLVEVDRVEIQQVLVNLLRNAVDALEDGSAKDGRRIEVAVEADDTRVRFSVTDTGPGILPEARSRIFEPFFTSKADGMGIRIVDLTPTGGITRRRDHGRRPARRGNRHEHHASESPTGNAFPNGRANGREYSLR